MSTPSEPNPAVNSETVLPDVIPDSPSIAPSPSLAPTMNDDEVSVAGCELPPCDPCVAKPVVEQPPAGPNPPDEKPSQLVLVSDEEGEGTCPVKVPDPDWPEWFDPMVEDSQPDPDWRYTAPKFEEPRPSASTSAILRTHDTMPPISQTNVSPCLPLYNMFWYCFGLARRLPSSRVEAEAPPQGCQDPTGCSTDHPTFSGGI